jgi:tRNA(Ile)-lysidine synthase
MAETTRVRAAVRDALDDGRTWVLAISGGIDSMCLLDAAATSLPTERLLVANFDHATGAHGRDAARLVEQHCRELKLRFHAGRALRRVSTEAAWRSMRWAFLRDVARSVNAGIVTAHTRDDQVETVLMRIMRDAGARGIAGLYADSDRIVRPFLGVSRAELETYGRAAGVKWLEDPTNSSRRHLRNRIRRDLLPALRRATPELDRQLLDLSRRAAAWRRDVAAVVDGLVAPILRQEAGLDVDSATFAGYSPPMLGTLWPAIVAKAGVALDHRGTRRLVAFTTSGRVGSRMQLSGGWEVIRSRHRFELRRVGEPILEPVELEDGTHWGRWWFRRVEATRPSDNWTARLPAGSRITVRRWMPGDTMTPAPGRTPRKVKRLLSSAGVTGHDRASWPVVVAEDEIVWIPGVRRTDAATDRSGRPVLTYHCEFDGR